MDKMLLIDLETQSFPVTSGIFEVACLAVENFVVIDKLYLGKEIKGYDGPRIYGFGFYDISQDKDTISEFQGFIKKHPYPLVAHNCPFDKKFLVYYGWVPEKYPFYCSMRAVRYEDNSLDSYALASLLSEYGIAEATEHQAMSDVLNLYKLLSQVKPSNWFPVGTGKTWTKIKPRPLEEIDLNIKTTKTLDSQIACFTGESRYPRNFMQEIAIKSGSGISNTVTSKTTLLVVGKNPGLKKIDMAQEKDICIITDEEFLRMLNLFDREILAVKTKM